jgi:hypothetical protein
MTMTSLTLLSRTAVALGAFAGVSLFWAEGCGPGDTRYYCDATGCYNCDGYGCHSVTPPPPTKCSGTASCAQNQICTDQGCEPICKVDTDCPQGDVCKSGLCVSPTVQPGNPIACTSNADCSNGDQCVGSGTWAKCEAPSNVCQYSSQCGQGKACANGECLVDCSQPNVTCPSGTTCTKGVCEPTTGTQCTSDAQCSGSTPKCEQGTCVAQCTVATDCPSGDVCESGACVPNTGTTPDCTGNTDCLSNQECLNGFCRYTCAPTTCSSANNCTTAQQCLLIDVRIGYCAKDDTCRDIQEAQAQCLSATDCASGQLCISNQCK